MEEVIKKIIKIEEVAQEIMASTHKENERKRQEAEEKLKALEEKLLGDAHRKAKELKKRELAENAVHAKEIGRKCDEQIKAMEASAVAHEEAWVTYLVDRVLGDG